MSQLVLSSSDPSSERRAAYSPTGLESFSYDDKIVRWFATATLAWGLVAFLAGLIVAILLVLPSASFGLPYFSFGSGPLP